MPWNAIRRRPPPIRRAGHSCPHSSRPPGPPHCSGASPPRPGGPSGCRCWAGRCSRPEVFLDVILLDVDKAGTFPVLHRQHVEVIDRPVGRAGPDPGPRPDPRDRRRAGADFLADRYFLNACRVFPPPLWPLSPVAASRPRGRARRSGCGDARSPRVRPKAAARRRAGNVRRSAHDRIRAPRRRAWPRRPASGCRPPCGRDSTFSIMPPGTCASVPPPRRFPRPRAPPRRARRSGSPPVPSPEGSAASRPRATSRPHRDRHAVPAQGADLGLRPGRVQAASAIRAQGFGLPVAAFGMVVRDAPKNLTPQRDPPMAAVRVRFARQSPEKGNRLQPSGCGITRSRTRGATCAAMPSGMSRRGQRRFCKAWSQTTGLPGIKAVPLGAAVRRIGRDPA